jgi:predicted  nucleic acid-binding Zn-ribbon protein
VAVDVIEKLLTLQEDDLKIRGMEKELRDIPVRKQREQARLDEHKKQVADAAQLVKERQAEIKRLQLEAEGAQDKIRKLRQQQLEIKTNKEFKAIETEVAALQDVIRKIEDGELDLMAQIEQAKESVKGTERALGDEEAAVKRDNLAWDKRAGEIEQDLAKIKAARAEKAKEIDAAWLGAYDRIFQRKDRALVALTDGICGGCHMKLPPFVGHDARRHTMMVTCSFCGRLLH